MRERLHARIARLTRERRPWRPTAGADASSAKREDLGTQSLRGIHDLWREDLVARVAAGCTLAQLERRLAAHGFTLGIDAPCPERSTLGGIFARAEPGRGGHPNQSLRARVLGLTAIDGDARLHKAGARVVKNVAGYDLARLHHGARGAFGMVLDFTLRLSARPRSITLRTRPCAQAQLGEQLHALRRPQAASDPQRLNWLNRPALAQLGASGDGLLIAEHHESTAGDATAPPAELAQAVRDFALHAQGYHLALPLRALLEQLEHFDQRGIALRADLLGGAHLVDLSDCSADERKTIAQHARDHGGWLIAREPDEPDPTHISPVARRLKQAFDPHALLPELHGPLA